MKSLKFQVTQLKNLGLRKNTENCQIFVLHNGRRKRSLNASVARPNYNKMLKDFLLIEFLMNFLRRDSHSALVSSKEKQRRA